MQEYTEDYLLNKRVKIFQPVNGYRAAIDAVFLASLPEKVRQGQKILDVGSGTGAVSLCLAERFKSAGVQITGLELQPELADLANRSAAANGFDFLHYENLDIRQKLPPSLPHCSFHHVISNPPYAERDMPSPNPSKAAAHNMNHFSLTAWLNFCIKMTAPKGFLYLINRTEALDEILSVLHGRLGNIRLVPLFSKAGQPAKRIMLSAQKDSKAPTVLLPGITVHQDDGCYTPQASAILKPAGSPRGQKFAVG